MTEGDTWQGMKPLLLGQIPPQQTAVRQLSLDFSELLFISPLLHCLTGTTNQFTVTDTRQQEASLTPTPSKLARAELFLSIRPARKSLQKIFG